MKSPSPAYESERLKVLRDYEVLDTPPEPQFDDIVALASQICGTPIALISLVDEKRHWFKARVGMEVVEIPREMSFCDHVVSSQDLLVVEDAAKDERFSDSPLVTGDLDVRFYAGMPFMSPSGHVLGALCLLDRVPRKLTTEQLSALKILSRQVTTLLRQARAIRKAEESEATWRVAARVSLGTWHVNLSDLIPRWSDKVCAIHEVPVGYVPNLEEAINFYAPEYRKTIERVFGACMTDGTPFDEELQILTANKRRVWVRAIGEAVRDSSGKIIQVQGVFQDINKTKLVELALVESRSNLSKAIAVIQEVSAGNISLDETYSLMVDKASEITHAQGATIELLKGEELAVCGANGLLASTMGAAVAQQETMSGQVLSTWELLSCDDVSASNRVNRAQLLKLGVHRILVAALREEDRSIGVLKVVAGRDYNFSDEDKACLQILAESFGAIINRRRVLERMRRSEEQYRLLFASNPIPMWTYDVETLRFLDVNDAAVGHYGYTREEFLGMTVLDIRSPEDKGGQGTAVKGLSGKGSLKGLRIQKKKTGEIIEVEVTSEPVEFNGRRARLALAQDVTERRRDHRVLAEQAALLDKAQDAIIVRDLSHRILYWNKSAERLYGWTAAEACGQSIRELLYREPGFYDEGFRTMMLEGEVAGEFSHLRKDGTDMMVESRCTLVRDEVGNPKSVLVINTDITERKILEKQFLRAQRMESIGTLAGGIAHDLNNLLSPIVMGVELLKLHQTNTDTNPVIDNIAVSARRGTDLVQQVLSFARGVEGDRSAVHLKHIVHELEGMMQSSFPKNIRVETDLAGDLALVFGDPTQLEQVLLNLCVNARDAMPDGGNLMLTGKNVELDEQFAALNPRAAAGRYVCLEVTDDGCGMEKEVIDRIFEPFFTTKEIGKGTGLGLSSVEGIIKSHGGFVNCYSEPDKGSIFKLYLPVHQDEKGAGSSLVNQPKHMMRGHGELILLVDDEESILTIAKQTLEVFGYRVVTATDGTHAVEIYKARGDEITAVISDMMMPVMDGPALFKELKHINPQVKIIAASGLNTSGNVARATSEGVWHFLAKPYEANAMLTLLHKLISGEAHVS